MRKNAFGFILAGMVLTLTPALYAEVKLPHVFSDHMVLQQDMVMPIRGTADAGEEVTVSVAGQEAKTKAGAEGKWAVRLKPIAANGSPVEMTVAGKNTLKIADVLIGEVWVASGQSNMQWEVKQAQNPDKEVAAADYPQIRMFTVNRVVAGKPMSDADGKWVVCSPKTAAEFSAVGYYFARDLHKTLNVPVGILNASLGGTPAEAWTSRPTLEADADLRVMVERWDKSIVDYRKTLEDYKKAMMAWIDESMAAIDPLAQPPKPAPALAPDPRDHQWRASGLYNAMIAPLVPYAIRGVIWYQGENNATREFQYRKLFSAMIQDWRQAWGQGEFPFLFVQLANYSPKVPRDGTWAELREAQNMALKLKNTATAVTIDIGNPAGIHPKNKQEVGRRLALAAQAIAYGKKLEYSGPMYESMSIEDNKVRLKFKHADGLKASDGQPPKGFIIAGEDKGFTGAMTQIDGNTVVVWKEGLAKPVAVRYGWNDNPTCTLYNGADLPASPFRTDDWPGLTVDAK